MFTGAAGVSALAPSVGWPSGSGDRGRRLADSAPPRSALASGQLDHARGLPQRLAERHRLPLARAAGITAQTASSRWRASGGSGA